MQEGHALILCGTYYTCTVVGKYPRTTYEYGNHVHTSA
jgi:hypothetical protein